MSGHQDAFAMRPPAAQALVDLTCAESGCELATVEIRALGGALDREPRFPDPAAGKGCRMSFFGFAVRTPDRAAELLPLI